MADTFKPDYPQPEAQRPRVLGLGPDEIERRRRGLFATDTPSIVLGEDPDLDRAFGSPLSVWLEKVRAVRASNPTPLMRMGLWLEPSILMWAEHEIGQEIERKVAVYPSGDGDDIFGAHLDGRLVGTDRHGRRGVVEAKLSFMTQGWGDPGTDQIPARYMLQTQHQMLVSDAEVAYVPVLLLSAGTMELYVVERNDALIDEIRDIDLRFWHEHVLANKQPAGPAREDILKRVERPSKSVRIPWELAKQYEVTGEAESKAKKDRDAARLALLTAGIDADVLEHDGGKYRIARESGGWSIAGDALKRLRREHPDIFAEYASEKERVVIRQVKEQA